MLRAREPGRDDRVCLSERPGAPGEAARRVLNETSNCSIRLPKAPWLKVFDSSISRLCALAARCRCASYCSAGRLWAVRTRFISRSSEDSCVLRPAPAEMGMTSATSATSAQRRKSPRRIELKVVDPTGCLRPPSGGSSGPCPRAGQSSGLGLGAWREMGYACGWRSRHGAARSHPSPVTPNSNRSTSQSVRGRSPQARSPLRSAGSRRGIRSTRPTRRRRRRRARASRRSPRDSRSDAGAR